MRRAPSVRRTRRVRPSVPSAGSTRRAVRIAVTVWLIAEWLNRRTPASSLMVSGPRRSRSIRGPAPGT
jgi:hypothetical protein